MKSYRPKRKKRYTWKEFRMDAFLGGILAFFLFTAWLHNYVMNIPVARADFSDNKIICLNLDEFVNGADFRDRCVEEIL